MKFIVSEFLCFSFFLFQKMRILKPIHYNIQQFQRSNQDTCLVQKPNIFEGEWVQPGDLLADCSASVAGELSLGQNILIAYMPWEGYNYEDAILISERLVSDDLYTSIHIEKYEVETVMTKYGYEEITREIPDVSKQKLTCLDSSGIIKVGAFVCEGDILVGKVSPIEKKYKSPYQKLLYTILEKELSPVRDSSLRAPKGLRAKVIERKIFKKKNVIFSEKNKLKSQKIVHLYLAEKRRIQVGDKMAGRHGNKGIISKILPQQDMPYLPDGSPIDMVLNPLGVPSRMNVGQIYECLLGLAAKYLGQCFRVEPFDERYGGEASRTLTFSSLYKARLKTGYKWLFNPKSPGKIKIYDGRTGTLFHQTVTVGISYMLKLVHLVDDKIHCLSSDHQVLTTVGWIDIEKLSLNHKIATLNNLGNIEYEFPTHVYHYNYEGLMYHIKNQDIDLFVTLKHRMYVKEKEADPSDFQSYQLIEAQYLKGKNYEYLTKANWLNLDYQIIMSGKLPYSKNYPHFLQKIPIETWLVFLGVWISNTEGLPNILSFKNDSWKFGLNFFEKIRKSFFKKTKISYSSLTFIEFIEQLVTELGYTYKILNNKIILNYQQILKDLRFFQVNIETKEFPVWIWNLSQNQARLFLQSLCFSSQNLHFPSLSYLTSCDKLADDFMRLALHAGWSARKLRMVKGTQLFINTSVQPSHVLSIANFHDLKINQNNSTPDKVKVSNSQFLGTQTHNQLGEEHCVPYKGSVYCLTVSSGIFYVRRNGCPVWTGNSRSTGPYSLVTQQPLRGRSKFGGQRLGEMEVWALEGYGAAFTLLEMLTIKSDDITGRMTLWSNLILHNPIYIGTPESFKVLVCELQALCLDIGLFKVSENSNKKYGSIFTSMNDLIKLP